MTPVVVHRIHTPITHCCIQAYDDSLLDTLGDAPVSGATAEV